MGETLERFMEELCVREQLIWGIFVIALTFLIVQVVYLAIFPVEEAILVVSVMNVVGFTVFLLGSGLLLRHCRAKYV